MHRFLLGLGLLLAGCAQSTEPALIAWGQDECAHCRMNITDQKFAAQLVTKKGRAYKFDDLVCLQQFEGVPATDVAQRYVANFAQPGNFIPLEKAYILKSEDVQSPMAGRMAAFPNAGAAQTVQSTWTDKGQLVDVTTPSTTVAHPHGHGQ